jgi:hypothetical protein
VIVGSYHQVYILTSFFLSSYPSSPSIQYTPQPLNLQTTQHNTIIMQFFTAILALAGSASAAALLPRSPMGSWHVQVTVDPDNSLYVTAPFHSDAYPDGLRNACVEDPNTTPPFHNCDHVEFDFSWDGKSKLSSRDCVND